MSTDYISRTRKTRERTREREKVAKKEINKQTKTFVCVTFFNKFDYDKGTQ